jgi:hypothetical protein
MLRTVSMLMVQKEVGEEPTNCRPTPYASQERTFDGDPSSQIRETTGTVAPSSESITRLNLTNYIYSSKSQLSYFGTKFGVFNSDRIA